MTPKHSVLLDNDPEYQQWADARDFETSMIQLVDDPEIEAFISRLEQLWLEAQERREALLAEASASW